MMRKSPYTGIATQVTSKADLVPRPRQRIMVLVMRHEKDFFENSGECPNANPESKGSHRIHGRPIEGGGANAKE
jgi:hypothetical protein